MYILLNKEKRIIARSDIKQNNFIEIEDEKMEEISKANIYDYIYINNEFIYKPIKVDLKKVLDNKKTQKREELKTIREDKVHSNFKINLDKEYEFQFREKDVNNFISFKSTLDILKTLGISNVEDANKLKSFNVPDEIILKIKEFLETGKVPWILADNSIELFEFEKILLIQALFNFRKEEIYFKFGELSMQLETCQSIEEIEAIKWE